jgi:outer membrane protein assembly factor BamB
MKKPLLIYFPSILLMLSCAPKVNLGINSEFHQKNEEITKNFKKKDILFPVKFESILERYRTITKAPILWNNHLIFLTTNGRLFSFDLEKKGIVFEKSIGFGTNISPLLNKDKIFLFSGVGKKTIRVFSIITHELLWEKDIPFGIESMPKIVNNLLFLATGSGKAYCLNSTNGEEIWATNLGAPVHAEITLKNDVIFIGDDKGVLHVLAKNDGRELWTKKINGAIYSKPTVINKNILISSIDGELKMIDLLTKKEIWSRKLKYGIYSDVSFDGKNIYFGANDSFFYKLDLDGNIIWKKETKSIISSTALLGEKNIYVGNGKGDFLIFSKKNGKILWKENFKGRFIAKPIFWKEKLLIFSDNDDIYLLENANNL